ncbi:hypothetical protein [Devosia submarina]|uniref:hypothetical protein n=1 Tax=Devosia submarina TaxID=1173082 RepID=UPI000D34C379|nr:hypothetical protein [Devosia submarina]
MSKLMITNLNHDFQNRKSFVVFVWSDDPSKHLGLEVPFGTALSDVEQEAEKAVSALAQELSRAEIVLLPNL